MVNKFLSSFDSNHIVDIVYHGMSHVLLVSEVQQVSWPVFKAHELEHWNILLHAVGKPTSFGSLSPTTIPLIVDSGVLVYISPCCKDFFSYSPSKVKICDLSPLDQVASKSMVCWAIWDNDGNLSNLKDPCYHIFNAEVHLHSPQVLLGLAGGQLIQI